MTERDYRIWIDGESFETTSGEFIEPERVKIPPRFVIYPPGATDETRKAVDDLIKTTWGEK